MTPVIEIRDLKKSFGKVAALQGLTFRLTQGSVCGLLGPNGAGKSTTLRTLFGLLRADSGEAKVFGLDCWKESPKVRQKVGWVNADARYPSWLNGRLALSLQSKKPSIVKVGEELAERLGLDLKKPLSKLSRGNLQKVGLMLALAPRPPLLLLDEPTSGLDPLLQEVFAQIIGEETERGATVLLSSHTFSEVERLCETVALVKEGQVVARGPLSDFRRKARRKVAFQLNGPLPDRLPESLLVRSYQDDRVLGFWSGELACLLDFIRALPVEDLEITAPLLDDAFLEHYG